MVNGEDLSFRAETIIERRSLKRKFEKIREKCREKRGKSGKAETLRFAIELAKAKIDEMEERREEIKREFTRYKRDWRKFIED